MLFGLQTKAFIIVAAICGSLVLALGFTGHLLLEAKTDLGFIESELNVALQVNEKNIEKITLYREDIRDQEVKYRELQARISSLARSLSNEKDKTRQLEAENENYRNWRSAVADAVANDRVQSSISATRDRILALFGADTIHPADTPTRKPD